MDETFHPAPHLPTDNVVAGARTVGEVFRRRAERTPDVAASYEKRGGEWRRITWRTLHRQAARAARGLVDLGLEAGERIAILGPTLVDWEANAVTTSLGLTSITRTLWRRSSSRQHSVIPRRANFDRFDPRQDR